MAKPPSRNKAAFHQVVKRGPAPGLLAFHGHLAVGWCQLTPRDAIPWTNHEWRLTPVDRVPVWSLSCLYVRKGYRRQGVTAALIEAGVESREARGAPALEAYPFDANFSGTSSSTGYASTFARAGFKIVERRIPARPIMRHDLRAVSA